MREMLILAAILGGPVVIWVMVTGWFFAVTHAWRLEREDVEFGPMVNVPLYIYGYVGLIWDVLFNATWGTVIFRELPRELLFTDRVQRHIEGTGRDQMTAWRWANRLNKLDPGHVKIPPLLERRAP